MNKTENDVYIFDNLISSSGHLGEENNVKVFAAPSTPVETTNASGSLRKVEEYDDIGNIAEESASNFLSAFTNT